MKKRVLILISVIAAVCLLSVSVFAASDPVITYKGGSTLSYTDADGNALSGNSDFGTAFSKMLPGVTYTQNIKLQNSDSKNTVRFYLDLAVLKTLQNSQLDGAGYTVNLFSGSETLYSSENGTHSGVLLGGAGTNELLDLNSDLVSGDGSGILVATLKPGESETISLSILADKTMSDAYQSASGTLSFQFFGEIVPPGKTEIIEKFETVYVNGGVQTGDNRPLYIVAGVLVLAVILFFVISRKKDKENKKTA